MTYHDPLFAAPDSKGRMWFWTDSLAGADNYAALHGILRYEGRKMDHYTLLAGLPDKPLTWIAPRGKRMWIAVKNTGLYELDAGTLSGTPVPKPHTFQSTSCISTLHWKCRAFEVRLSAKANNRFVEDPDF